MQHLITISYQSFVPRWKLSF